jgi:uncharacterized protein DUF3489
VAAQAAPEKSVAKKAARPKKRGSQAKKSAQGGKAMAKTKASSRKRATAPGQSAPAAVQRAGSKSAKILELIGHAQGASLAALMKATQWQAHSVRGFLSVAAKKHRLQIESTKNQAGDRIYRVIK